jgi:hypothetical protein
MSLAETFCEELNRIETVEKQHDYLDRCTDIKRRQARIVLRDIVRVFELRDGSFAAVYLTRDDREKATPIHRPWWWNDESDTPLNDMR